jgi:hypothetical protein
MVQAAKICKADCAYPIEIITNNANWQLVTFDKIDLFVIFCLGQKQLGRTKANSSQTGTR